MRRFAALFGKEAKALFTSPIAYVVVTMFLLIMGYTFTARLFLTQSATLIPDFFQAPGRLNLVDLGGVTVLLDYAHNAHGMGSMAQMIRDLTVHGRRIGVECKRRDAPNLTPSMRIALSDLKLDRLIVTCAHQGSLDIYALPLTGAVPA